jgi:sigma-B regulation protein RsbU (phosphoserine phosphatase)
VEDVSLFLHDEDVQLESGDVILLYTDGVVEAKNRENDMFGVARLQKDVVEIAAQTQNGYLNALVEDIEEFVSGAEQHDDITMLSLCVESAESV